MVDFVQKYFLKNTGIPMIHSQAVGGDANRSWENPDVEGTAHIRVLPFCLLKFIYTPGFEKYIALNYAI